MALTRSTHETPCTVTGCHNPAHERHICTTCAQQLHHNLTQLPDLLNELATTLARQTRITTTNGTRTTEQPLPYNPHASEATAIIRSTLIAWTREIHDGAEYWPTESLHHIAIWLKTRHHRLINHPQAHEAVDEIGAAMQNATQTIDRPIPKLYAGTCSVDYCDGELYAKPAATTVHCPTCGIQHDVAERRHLMRQELDGMLLTAAQIARLGAYFDGLPQQRTRNLLATWERRGRLAAHGHTPEGAPLYPFGATITAVLEAQTTRRLTPA